MKHTFQLVISLALVAFFCGRTNVQAQGKHEFSLEGGAGVHALSYSIDKGSRSSSFGGAVGFSYRFYINSSLSLRTGIEYACYRSKAKINSLSDGYQMKDSEGDMFIFRSTISGFEEEHYFRALNIPIMVQYEHPVIGVHKVYGSLGARLAVPISSKYESSGAELRTSAYYPDYGLVLDNVPGQGFGSYTQGKVKDEWDSKLAIMLSAEVGFKWSLDALVSGLSAYTGIYVDYGLNDIRKEKDKNFLQYNVENPRRYVTSSVLESRITQDGKEHQLTDKVVPFAYGLKLGLAFSF